MLFLQAVKLEAGLEDKVTVELIEKKLMQNVPQQKKKYVKGFTNNICIYIDAFSKLLLFLDG